MELQKKCEGGGTGKRSIGKLKKVICHKKNSTMGTGRRDDLADEGTKESRLQPVKLGNRKRGRGVRPG